MLFHAQFPYARLRRMRCNESRRQLIQEQHLHPSQLILPVFVIDGVNHQEPIASMPGVQRYTIDRLFKVAEHMLKLGVQHMALFPVIESNYKTPNGDYALDDDSLIPRAIRMLKARFPNLQLIADVALDPYTSHGQDGLIDANGYVLNDETNAVLVKQSLLYAQCGVDILAPSDMMDGRIGLIRQFLEKHRHPNIAILAYSAKYASAFYGPFRDAVGSSNALKGDKKTYQMNPANLQEALREAILDMQEGADILMVKPGLPYLDVIYNIKQQLGMPVCAYHVSGEYSMLKLAANAGLINYDDAILETMFAFKRAGCDAVITYSALDVAQLLKDRY